MGECFGFHTLSSILEAYDKSTKLHTVLKQLSFKDVTNMCATLFMTNIEAQLVKLWQQNDSQWSRATVTLVIDSSIYKQWLSENCSEFYDLFFSGQVAKPVYGFRLTLGGIAIGDTFYPMIFYISSKNFTDSEVAQVIISQMSEQIENMRVKHHLPTRKLYLSIDNGFNDTDLIELSDNLQIVPICVPKKNQYFVIDGKRVKLSDFIENQFVKEETEYYETHSQDQDFCLRKKANYVSKNKEVILLIFRFKKSDKISVIYTTDLDIKAKTLRHHWFQRTLIEQFFRFSKDTLEFAKNKCRNEDDFIQKICINYLKISICLSIRNKIRKFKPCRRYTFGTIRLKVKTHQIAEDLFLNYLNY